MKIHLQVPTPELAKSKEYYQTLGFETLSEDSGLWASDGSLMLHVNPDRFARAGVCIFKPDGYEVELKRLKSHTFVEECEDYFLVSEPSNTWIYLLKQSRNRPDVAAEIDSSHLGHFAGLSLETTNIALSLKIYQALGYVVTMGDEKSGFVQLSAPDENAPGIALMKANSCPHLFFNPSLTYFNGKKRNPEIIGHLRDLKVEITEEITHFNQEGLVDNVLIRDPGGLGIFVFNDGED